MDIGYSINSMRTSRHKIPHNFKISRDNFEIRNFIPETDCIIYNYIMRLPDSPLILPPLPYKLDALWPVINSESMSIHYHGHHQAYVDNYNKLLKEGGSKEDKEFNYGGHVLHSLLWKNLAPFPTE